MKRNGILFLTKYPDTMKCHTVHKSVCRHFKTCQIPWERKPRNPSPSFSLVPCNTALLMVCDLLIGPSSEAFIQHLHVFIYWKAQVVIYSPEFAPPKRASSLLKLPQTQVYRSEPGHQNCTKPALPGQIGRQKNQTSARPTSDILKLQSSRNKAKQTWSKMQTKPNLVMSC